MKSHSAAFILKCGTLMCLMLNFTLDKTKTMYAAIHTYTAVSAKYKTLHKYSITVYFWKSWKLRQLLIYILLFRTCIPHTQTQEFKRLF